MSDPPMKFEPPREFTPQNICYWEPDSKQLMVQRKEGDSSAGALLTKARRFLEENCIEKSEGCWICKPIKGYNRKTYHMKLERIGWTCSCQGFKTKIEKGESPICSHIVALKQKIFSMRFKEDHYGLGY